MEGENTSGEEPARADTAAAPKVASAASMLVLTAVVGAGAKIFGVAVAPGMRGIASQRTMDTVELISATLGYTFAALLVALICGASFELARARKIGVVSRGTVIAVSGLVGSLGTLRVVHTRILGVLLAMIALSGLLRPLAWQLGALANDRASLSLYNAGRAVSAAAVVVQGLAALLAAAWLGTRSPVRGRLLSNGAIIVAFGITYLAAHDSGETPSAVQAVLSGSLSHAVGVPLPYGLTTVAAFLVPATILLALVSVVQRVPPPAVLASLALVLLSTGALDVPLHALAVTAAAQWAMLARADDRAMWSALVRERAGAQRAGV